MRLVFAVVLALSLTGAPALAQDPGPDTHSAQVITPPASGAPGVQAEQPTLRATIDHALQEVIAAVVTGVLGMIAVAFHALQKKWAAQAEREEKGSLKQSAELAGAKAAHLAELVAHGLASSGDFAKLLAKDLIDGKIDESELADLKAVGVSELRGMLGAGGLKDIEDALGITGSALDAFLEAHVVKALNGLPIVGGMVANLARRAATSATVAAEQKVLAVVTGAVQGNVLGSDPAPTL